MKIDSLQARALQRARELQEQGHPQRDIAKILEDEGHPPPGRSKTWNQSAVRLFLQRLNATPAPPSPPSPPSITAVSAPAAVDPPPAAAPAPAASPSRRRPLKVKIHGPWIQSDSLLWEFLVQAAWDHLTEKTSHTLPIQEALNGLPVLRRRRDPAHLADALDRLAASRVKVEDELGDERLLMSIPLLAAILTETAVSFQFPDTLIKMVKNPQEHLLLRQLFAAKH